MALNSSSSLQKCKTIDSGLTPHTRGPVPTYYFSKHYNKHYIIFSHHFITKYDIKKDEFIKCSKDEFIKCYLLNHSQALDEQNEKVMILHGTDLRIFDLKTNEWDIISNTDNSGISGDGHACNSQFIQHPISELHILGNKYDGYDEETEIDHHILKHLKFNQTEQKFIELSNGTDLITASGAAGLLRSTLLYIKKTKQLLIMGGCTELYCYSDKIWCCDVNNSYKWTLSALKLPYKTEPKGIILFNNIILIFEGHKQEIWLFDLKNRDIASLHNDDNSEWIKLEFKMPEYILHDLWDSYVLATEFNLHIHFIKMYRMDIGEQLYHVKISIFDLIPYRLIKRYVENKYNNLVFGYVREHSLFSIPVAITKLILSKYCQYIAINVKYNTMNKRCCFKWNFNEDELEKLKSGSNIGINSDDFNNHRIVCIPNGNIARPGNRTLFIIKALKLSDKIKYFKIKHELQIESDQDIIKFNQTSKCFKDGLKFNAYYSRFADANKLSIALTFDIVKIVDIDNVEIPQNMWSEYGVVSD